MLNKFIQVVEGLTVYPEHMLINLARTHGLIFSQRVLLELMHKGLKRPVAYDIVQRAAMKTWKDGANFKDNLCEEEEVGKYLSRKELDNIFDLDYYLRQVDYIFDKVGL
jgi:adenylosuccinate lyase